MKKVLFSTFLFLIIFTLKSNASSFVCKDYINYDYLSTNNIFNYLASDDFTKIKKICTNNICTDKLHSNNKLFLIDHEENVLRLIKNDDKKIEIKLKGIKIDKIYFNECI